MIALAALAVGGCSSPAHLSDSYARTSRRAFERQAVLEPGAEAAKPVSGLDSQEAATVSDSYRKSLAPKGTQKVEDEMIYIAPKKDGVQMRAIMPPPSVPQAERH